MKQPMEVPSAVITNLPHLITDGLARLHDLVFQLGGALVEDEQELLADPLQLFQGHLPVHVPEPVLTLGRLRDLRRTHRIIVS